MLDSILWQRHLAASGQSSAADTHTPLLQLNGAGHRDSSTTYGISGARVATATLHNAMKADTTVTT